MKALYISSIETFSGKTAVCLALGKYLQSKGHKVGYLKPVSTQPWQTGAELADEDAGFVKTVLGLEEPAAELAPVIITHEMLVETLKGESKRDLAQEVKTAFDKAARGKDVLLLEGGSSLREGYSVYLPTPEIAGMLGAQAVVVVKYRGPRRVMDDALTARFRLGDVLLGIIINNVPQEAMDFVENVAQPNLESRDIPVFGVLPQEKSLAAISVGELVETLGAEVLTGEDKSEELVETLTVGAMSADSALKRFRRQQNKAVITGGDRTDIQLAALETSTTCLILTGNLHPSPLVLQLANDVGVAVLLVPGSTMETVEAIEEVFGKTRLGFEAKFSRFRALMDEHVDFERIREMAGL